MSAAKRLPWYFAVFLFAGVQAAEEQADAKVEEEIDAEFLEYLGSVESQEENWTDFESREQTAQAKPVAQQESQSAQQTQQAQQAQTTADDGKAKTP